MHLCIGSYEHSSLILIRVLTSLHVGTGKSAGVVDLPIARDNLNLPFIPASSLKGALRTYFKGDEELIIFGSRPLDKEHYAGALAVLDGCLLAFPARSLKGVWVLVTSSLLLKRFMYLADIVGFSDSVVSESLWMRIEGLEGDQVLASLNGRKKLSINGSIILNEEFELKLPSESLTDNEIEQIAKRYLKLDDSWRLVIVHDDILYSLVERSILRRTRIRLEKLRKVAKERALWTEEELPAETRFITCFFYSKGRKPGKDVKDANEIRKIVEEKLFRDCKGYVIFGGHETIGRGLVEVVNLSCTSQGDEIGAETSER